jgi:hypothetical protein
MGGAAALGVMAVLGLVAALLLNKPKPPAAASDQAAASSVAAGAPNLASYQQAAEQAIGATPCAWYEVEGMAPAAGGVNVTLTGVSGNPGSAQAFKDSVQKAAGGTVTVTEDKVALIASSACAALDAARQFRAPPATAGQWIKPLQSEFRTGVKRPECGNDPAQALTPIDIAGASEPGEDDTVIGWDSTGKVQTLYTGAAQFDAFRASLAGTPNANVFEVTPTGRRLNLCADVGDQGILVIRGAKPSSLGLPGLASHGLKSGPPPPDFPARFDAAAQANGRLSPRDSTVKPAAGPRPPVARGRDRSASAARPWPARDPSACDFRPADR